MKKKEPIYKDKKNLFLEKRKTFMKRRLLACSSLLSLLFCASAFAAEVQVSFLQNTSLPDTLKITKEIQLITNRAAEIKRDPVTQKVLEVKVNLPDKTNPGIFRAIQAITQNKGVAVIIFTGTTKACPILNGQGLSTFLGLEWSPCVAKSCQSGFHIENNLCVSDVQVCTVANGTGLKTYNSQTSAYGACLVSSCNSSFHIENNLCVSDVQSCPIDNGSGLKTYSSITLTYSACLVSSCDSSFHIENNLCVSDVQSCPVDNGLGTKTFSAQTQSYGTCLASSCNSGFHIENNACQSDVQSCTIDNGSGTQTFNLLAQSYDPCQVSACNSGYHIFNNACQKDDPPVLSYDRPNVGYNPVVYQDVYISPSTLYTPAGASVSNCTVTPTLPLGLSLDSRTCVFTGKALYTAAFNTYTVSMVTSDGQQTSAAISFAVHGHRPDIIYANYDPQKGSSSFNLSVGDSVNLLPTITLYGAQFVFCQITPSLPEGLNFDPATCRISGQAQNLLSPTQYLVQVYSSYEPGYNRGDMALMISISPKAQGGSYQGTNDGGPLLTLLSPDPRYMYPSSSVPTGHMVFALIPNADIQNICAPDFKNAQVANLFNTESAFFSKTDLKDKTLYIEYHSDVAGSTSAYFQDDYLNNSGRGMYLDYLNVVRNCNKANALALDGNTFNSFFLSQNQNIYVMVQTPYGFNSVQTSLKVKSLSLSQNPTFDGPYCVSFEFANLKTYTGSQVLARGCAYSQTDILRAAQNLYMNLSSQLYSLFPDPYLSFNYYGGGSLSLNADTLNITAQRQLYVKGFSPYILSEPLLSNSPQIIDGTVEITGSPSLYLDPSGQLN